MKVVLASRNAHKLQEIQAILAKYDMELVLQSEAAPDLEAAADYARRYANWRLLTDKLGEWRMRMETR